MTDFIVEEIDSNQNVVIHNANFKLELENILNEKQ